MRKRQRKKNQKKIQITAIGRMGFTFFQAAEAMRNFGRICKAAEIRNTAAINAAFDRQGRMARGSD